MQLPLRPLGQSGLLPQRKRRHVCRATQQQAVAFEVRQATSAAELRAAGYLRANTFYTYPPDRSEYSLRMHRRMKGDAEWNSVTNKVNGTDPDYKALRVVCLIAAVYADPDCPVASQAAAELDASTQLPADASLQQQQQRRPQLVVGSLDLNQGALLPAEDLVGRLPPADQATRRGYLSNVCVAPAARRQGIAAALMQHAEELARSQGVEHLYVHVVADNAPAHKLYLSLGFEQETEETEAFAHALRRPRRLLLHKQLS